VGYLTLNEAPDTATCRALFVPDSPDCLAIVRGALMALTIPENWDLYGTLTQEESAAVFVAMFNSFCLGEGACDE